MKRDDILNSTVTFKCGDYGTIKIPLSDIVSVNYLDDMLEEFSDEEDIMWDLEDYVYDWFTSNLTLEIK